MIISCEFYRNPFSILAKRKKEMYFALTDRSRNWQGKIIIPLVQRIGCRGIKTWKL